MLFYDAHVDAVQEIVSQIRMSQNVIRLSCVRFLQIKVTLKQRLTDRYSQPAFLLKTNTPSGLFSSSGEGGGDYRTQRDRGHMLRHSWRRHYGEGRVWYWPVMLLNIHPLRSCGSHTVWCRPGQRCRDRVGNCAISVEELADSVWSSSSLVLTGHRKIHL